MCGHTHLQFDRSLAGVRVVNPGSVGAPTVRPAAWWAVLGPEVELKVTECDTDNSAKPVKHSNRHPDMLLPWTPCWAVIASESFSISS